MKKLIIAVIALAGFSTGAFAQTTPAKATAAPKAQVVKHVAATAPATTTTAAAKPASAAPLKKDGTPDKRFSANKHLKADGTPDKRFKEHKKS